MKQRKNVEKIRFHLFFFSRLQIIKSQIRIIEYIVCDVTLYSQHKQRNHIRFEKKRKISYLFGNYAFAFMFYDFHVF